MNARGNRRDPPGMGDGKVNEQVTVAVSGPGSGDSEVNVGVNGGAHPSRREPTSRLRVA
jgi:hypothetical protein